MPRSLLRRDPRGYFGSKLDVSMLGEFLWIEQRTQVELVWARDLAATFVRAENPAASEKFCVEIGFPVIVKPVLFFGIVVKTDSHQVDVCCPIQNNQRGIAESSIFWILAAFEPLRHEDKLAFVVILLDPQRAEEFLIYPVNKF